MQTVAARMGVNFIFIAVISFLIVLAMNPQVISSIPVLNDAQLQTFKTMWIGIVLEALPFILLGVFVSSFMQEFVSERIIRKLVPRNPILGILFACVLGIIFPVCECGMIPVVKRLIQKGMPVYIGVVFFLVGPIVNPVVYAATYMAFRSRPEMVYARMGLALAVAAVIGLILYRFVKTNPLKQVETGSGSHSHEHHHHDHDHHHHDHDRARPRLGGRLLAVLEHSAGESFDMGKYLMFGALVTAAMQTFVSRASLVEIGHGDTVSQLFMMGFAYVLSLCSTSDAFVAASFGTTFSGGALLAFLVFGPMLDFKSTLMLLSVFRGRFVLILSLLLIVTVFIGSTIVGQLYLY